MKKQTAFKQLPLFDFYQNNYQRLISIALRVFKNRINLSMFCIESTMVYCVSVYALISSIIMIGCFFLPEEIFSPLQYF